jgi:4-amino-4-deoxy-L-arabinose transferase-like glycosyltransferase
MTLQSQPEVRRWSWQSISLITAVWAVLQIGGLFTPGLLDDVDSVYIQIAREMLQRHDFVTPTIDGIRFFDKPPLMYWLAAGSMHVFGVHDWAARLPLALGVLALLLVTYALGLRLLTFAAPPEAPDRPALYAALALATSLGLYLYTRFFIPDILLMLWLALCILLLLYALDAAREQRPTWLPALGFAVSLALSLLTKGLIGLVFPFGFALLYIVLTRSTYLLRKLPLVAASAAFLVVALPWHVLAALRNPAVPMPAGVGLPARAGWAWFYLYNEHVARFLSRRIPHDYGNVPRLLFWLLLVLWLIPWAAFLPVALQRAFKALFQKTTADTRVNDAAASKSAQEAAVVTLLWTALVLGFFTLSARQEYYHLPALPALALLIGWVLAAGEGTSATAMQRRALLRASAFGLVPLATLVAVICMYFAVTAHRPAGAADLYAALSSNPALYNLSLGHVFDLTTGAMAFFRGPLLLAALGMLTLGPVSHLVRRTRPYTANLLVVAGMMCVLLAAHEGLVRFYPILGSRPIAAAVNAHTDPQSPQLVLLDGELTSGSSVLFYTRNPVLLVNGRVNGPWFGSFWPDAPHIFLDDAQMFAAWHGPRGVFLMTYHPDVRIPQLCRFGAVTRLLDSGGKTLLSNRGMQGFPSACAR